MVEFDTRDEANNYLDSEKMVSGTHYILYMRKWFQYIIKGFGCFVDCPDITLKG